MRLLHLLILLLLNNSVRLLSQPIEVKIKKTGTGFQLIREGKPYFIKGVGGTEHLERAKEIGANSVRTWHYSDDPKLLDKAQALGLTVCLGYWVIPERQGFNYDDEAAVKKQIDSFREIVLKFKDHPALLVWGIGNEVNLNYTNKKVWKSIQAMAKVVHELDGKHPTMTVTAGIGQDLVSEISEQCPDVDLLGVNVYGDAPNVPRKIRDYGWKKPFAITEWGATGHWEVEKTKWNAPIEETSTEKAIQYKSRYETAILADSLQCVGSYVFLWGQKQERTPTWYGVFLEDNSETEVLDVLEKFWKGSEPKNHAPKISSFILNDRKANSNAILKSGKINSALVEAADPDHDKLTVRWEILPEGNDFKEGGDREERPKSVQGLFQSEAKNQTTFLTPKIAGQYRLYVYVQDGKGKSATANIPFQVER